MTCPNRTTLVEVKKMIHGTVTKAFGSEVTVHDILITSSSCASGGQEK